MTSSIDYDLEMIETYTTTSLDAEFISNHDIESSSEQANPIVRKRTDRFEPERFAFDSNDFRISLDFQGTDKNSALDRFRLVFDDDFMAKILEETIVPIMMTRSNDCYFLFVCCSILRLSFSRLYKQV